MRRCANELSSAARKELEAAFQNDDDSDGEYDDGLLNLGEEEGL